MEFLEPFPGNVGVYLRGGQIAVPQQQLHHAQIRAMVHQVGGEGMAQRVG
jgi:hypothetical protein